MESIKHVNPELAKTIPRIRTTRKEIFFQILIVFVIPIFLIQADIIPINDRVPMLVILVSALASLLIFFEYWTPSMFGLSRKALRKYVAPYLVFTVIMMLMIIGFGEYILKQEELHQWWKHNHFLYLFFIVSLFQEIAYRGYLIPALAKLTKNTATVVMANALIFTLLHVIFPNPMIGLPVAFVGGIGFAIMYLRYPSLPLIILSHAALNFVVVLYGFFVIPGVTY